jgi:hypothetical protein
MCRSLPPRSALPARLRVTAEPVASSDPPLAHKTTERDRYERAGDDAGTHVLLWKEHGHMTETTIPNLAVKVDSRWYVLVARTPGIRRRDESRCLQFHLEVRGKRASPQPDPSGSARTDVAVISFASYRCF